MGLWERCWGCLGFGLTNSASHCPLLALEISYEGMLRRYSEQRAGPVPMEEPRADGGLAQRRARRMSWKRPGQKATQLLTNEPLDLRGGL